ncbi:MAG: molybdenum cofactor guanylyltransferase, partial [Candidatus Omnitrophota bacterium]
KIKNIGPLGGIFSALSYYTAGESVFFVGCDMPFLHNEMIQRQLTYFNKISCDALIPKISSFIEPLHAIYKTSLKVPLREFIKNNTTYSIRGFLENINVKYMHLENTPYTRQVFRNINTPQDLKQIL